jgi:hypothetical protein
MPRVLAAAVILFLSAPRNLRADAFDHYINDVLVKVPTAPGVKRVKQLTRAELADHGGVLPGIASTFLVVKTNEGRFSKLLVQAARQKVKDGASLPILLIERFTTYKEDQERAVMAAGQNVRLFHDFQFSLDLGQVVPAAAGGDLRFVAQEGRVYVEPVGNAELYLLTKPLAEAAPKKAEKVVVGAAFEPRYFTGKYKLYDDGRRTGTLHLKVGEGNEVTGAYYSDKDGSKYEVTGKVGAEPHSIRFKVAFPKVSQAFSGWMFTGDGRAITGSSVMQGRQAGFYAVRVEE